jgi:hypothetical protein
LQPCLAITFTGKGGVATQQEGVRMGIGSWVHNRRRMSQPVAGNYLLSSCSLNDGQGMHETCHMHGVVSAPGLEPTAVAHVCMTPSNKWPQPGQTLAVTVDLGDPTMLKIDWKQQATGAQLGMAQAQALAAAARTQADGLPQVQGSEMPQDMQDQLAKLAGLSPDSAAAVHSFKKGWKA